MCFSTSSTTLVSSCLFDDGHSDRCEVTPHCGVICIALMISSVEHLLVPLATCMSSLEKCLFFCLFFNQFICWRKGNSGTLLVKI